MKYVMMQWAEKDIVFEYPILFPNTLVHADVAEAMKSVIPGAVVISAGDLSSTTFHGHCSGESTSLGLKSRPQDTEILKYHDYLHGVIDT